MNQRPPNPITAGPTGAHPDRMSCGAKPRSRTHAPPDRVDTTRPRAARPWRAAAHGRVVGASRVLTAAVAYVGAVGAAAAGYPGVGSLEDSPDPAAVIHGGIVPACAWPTVGAFYEDKGAEFGACGAVYIGGRVIVTAAHCVQNDGFALEPACEQDSDCPDLDTELGGPSR